MPRVITAALLSDLFTAHKANFRSGLQSVSPIWDRIATKVISTAGTESYDWLGEWPKIREWIGDRVLKELQASSYTIKNKPFESSVRVKRDNIEDDQLGIYTPMFVEMGRSTAVFPDELVLGLLAQGRSQKCYDGQLFFDTAHPIGTEGATASNFQDGAGPAWYLLDTTRALKPLIYQERRPLALTALDHPTDVNVFMRAEYVYGVDGRMNAGFGFWQMAYMSKAPLTVDNYKAARAAMGGLKSDEGKSLDINANILLVPRALEGDARTITVADQINGTKNIWAGTAETLATGLLS